MSKKCNEGKIEEPSLTLVKVETPAESINDIHNYLETFNKEIEGGGNAVTTSNNATSTTATTASRDSNTYYVDSNGQYYYGQSVLCLQGQTEEGEATNSGGNFVAVPASAIGQKTVVPVQSSALATTVSTEPGQVLLNADGSIGTLALMPQDGSTGGEVSYVLIVQTPQAEAQSGVQDADIDDEGGGTRRERQPKREVDEEDLGEGDCSKEEVEGQEADAVDEGEEQDPEQSLTVYDFDEDPAAAAVTVEQQKDLEDSETEEDSKFKVVRIVSSKKQQSIATHMCNYCNYTSPKRYLLSRHMKSHSEERPHKCSVCERGFKTLASLQNHLNTHTGTKPHHCRFCDSSFTTSGELVRHVRYRHTHEKPHRCPECDYASVELSKLKRHVRCHTGERPYQLVRHIRYRHTHEKPHKCTQCDYASVELSKLRNHIRCHTGERPYQCPHCTYASPDTFKLKRHLRIHTGEKPYECDVCHQRFTQSNSLKAHRMIHSVADKPVFRCELCPATCGRKTDLRIHVQKLHTSDKILKCRRCGKTFPDRYTYKVHAKTHEGEKCFRCDLCPYASVSARHLESHMLIHTDQKPYVCDSCDQSFRQKQLLKRHQNLYHNPNYVAPLPKEKTHECPECGRTFRHKGNLFRHMAVHDPDSTAHERQMALKLGRQKKIQYIDGQQVEVVTGEEFEELTDGDGNETNVQFVSSSSGDAGSTVDGAVPSGATTTTVQIAADNNGQYVVLEVIQLQEGEEPGEMVLGTDGGTTLLPGSPTGLSKTLQSSAGQHDDDQVMEVEEDEEEEEDGLVEEISPEYEQDPLETSISERKSGDISLIKIERRSERVDGMDDCFGFGGEDDDEDLDEENLKSELCD